MASGRYAGVRAKKRFGQNFLHDRRILTAIADSPGLTADDWVLEIGPGMGDLTSELLPRAGRLTAIEIDHDLVARLQKAFGSEPNFELIDGDVLKQDLATLANERQPTGRRLAVANIPYYITTPIIMALLDERNLKRHGMPERPLFDSITVMVQKEVADRMAASAGTKEYGALTVICQYAAEVRKVLNVPRGAFKPAPKVDSAVVELRPRRSEPMTIADRALFWRVVASIFTSRRKQLRNSLSQAGVPADVLDRLAARRDLTVRGETLDLDGLAALNADLVAAQGE
jgi:16S rRNA (adenine1518-N6/adenine1519-N6)-dimethyltransferase